MDQRELQELWGRTIRSPNPGAEQLDELAQCVVETYDSGDARFRQHIKNRFKRVATRTGHAFDPDHFDLAAARAFIADEIGFRTWDELISVARDRTADAPPLLFRFAVAAMDMGNFSSLESTIGGPAKFHDQIVHWYEKGYFRDEPDALAEVFSAACMLGHERTAAYLLDHGVDPLAGIRTGLNGFHYAASSGRLAVIKLLIERKVPMEVLNMYNGTVFGQALWSAVNEHKADHAEIIEALIDAGAVIEDGTLAWWNAQTPPSAETKIRVAAALRYAERK